MACLVLTSTCHQTLGACWLWPAWYHAKHGATGWRCAQVLTSMETVAGNYKVMDGKILEKEGKMHILQHKCALGLTRLSMLSHPSYNMFK